MGRPARWWKAALGGLAVAAAAAAAGTWLARREPPTPAPAAAAAKPLRDEAAAAGLTFRMRFLPGEQGEPFKVNLYDHGCGVAVGDFDGAGRDDIWALAGSPREDNLLYRNNGDGTFTEVGAKAGLRGPGWSGDVAVFDYDGDGRPDVLVTQMFGASQLYRNKGDGTFEDVTARVLGRTPWGAI